MPHGDLDDARMAKCECSHCTEARAFQEFRDLAEPPPRPSKIDSRISAAQFLRWYAWQFVAVIGRVEEAMED